MTPWARATLAVTLLGIDPRNLGGLVVRARVGPAREALMRAADTLPMPSVRLHPHMTAQVLDGDIDLSATLSGNALVRKRGLLDQPPSLFVLPMAERVDPFLSARLGQALDSGRSHALLALDEGAEEGEALPPSLRDRAAFHVDLEAVALSDLTAFALPDDLPALRQLARKVHAPESVLEDLVLLAVSLGISSLRAPTFALCAAQAHAALHGRETLSTEDVTAAVALVYAHRATQLPQPDDPDSPEPAPAPEAQPQESQPLNAQDILLDAVTAALPADLLANLHSGAVRRASGTGSGTRRIGNRRGRPLPARQGPKANASRIDLIASLRAAIPWQTLRRRAEPARTGPIFRASDLRQKRYETLSDRLLVFAVDASGSAAMSRLAEAKGAVELLLAEAYARRDHVALVSYRGSGAEVLLAPTRSLVQTKRRLAAIPGGGATPLAAGLTAAITLAQSARQKGLAPTIVLLADGRANVALDGTNDRARAHAEALNLGGQIAQGGTPAIVIDATSRPEKALRELARHMDAKYLSLPRTDARRVSAAISAALTD